ncbi:MAG: YceI family protein [Pseudomonadota bacterium]
MQQRHPHFSSLRRSLVAALLLASLAAPAALGIDAGKSKVAATFRQMNVPVEGVFTKAGGSILFDPAKPQAATASIQIDTASFDLGMDDYNAEVRKKEWFDSAAFPQASFVSTSFKALGADRYQASGKLSLKGRSIEVTLPVSVKCGAAATVFSGTLPLSRKAFNIGDAEWNAVVDDNVKVTFSIVQPH